MLLLLDNVPTDLLSTLNFHNKFLTNLWRGLNLETITQTTKAVGIEAYFDSVLYICIKLGKNCSNDMAIAVHTTHILPIISKAILEVRVKELIVDTDSSPYLQP